MSAKTTHLPPHGFLVVDKPTGITSRDAVNRVQKWFPRRTRLGHAGTLDPLATGVLVVGVGAATRLIEYVQLMDKEYETDLVLGATSDTDDADGTVTPRAVTRPPTVADVKAALPQFLGVIEQVPPAYSAAKVQGRRAYDLARKDQEVTLDARPVRIDAIDVLGFEYPHLALRVRCGKGTYIRSLARDLGEALGCGAYVRTLRRTRIGHFTPAQAVGFERPPGTRAPDLLPLSAALTDLPTVEVTAESARKLRQGQHVAVPPTTAADSRNGEVREVAILCGPEVIGVGSLRGQPPALFPDKILALD